MPIKNQKELINRIFYLYIHEPEKLFDKGVELLRSKKFTRNLIDSLWRRYNPLNYIPMVMTAGIYVYILNKLMEHGINFQILCLMVISMSAYSINRRISEIEDSIKDLKQLSHNFEKINIYDAENSK